MTAPRNCRPARPSSNKIMLSASDNRQSTRNCQAKPSKRRTSSDVGYWRSLLCCGDESDIQATILHWNGFSIQRKEIDVSISDPKSGWGGKRQGCDLRVVSQPMNETPQPWPSPHP